MARWYPHFIRHGILNLSCKDVTHYLGKKVPNRKGVADMPRRAEVANAANNRLTESLATVAEAGTLGELLKSLGQPVFKEGGASYDLSIR